MADDIQRGNTPNRSESQDAKSPPSSARAAWATPRVLAFERFAGTGGPPDGYPMEGTMYGPS